MAEKIFKTWTKFEGGYFMLNSNENWNEFNDNDEKISTLIELDSYVKTFLYIHNFFILFINGFIYTYIAGMILNYKKMKKYLWIKKQNI